MVRLQLSGCERSSLPVTVPREAGWEHLWLVGEQARAFRGHRVVRNEKAKTKIQL